ncbi:MAG: Fic family protein [Acidimicrobiia bacterium]
MPDPIGGFDRPFALAVQERCEAAAAALSRLDQRLPVAWEPIARLLLRSEGTASSQIEGLRVPVRRLLEVQLDAAIDDDTARWVLGNIEAIEQAAADAVRPMSIDALLAWHSRLMQHSGLPEAYVGRFREEPGWIGGRTPLDAVFVPAPHEYVPGLMDDLVRFCNRSDLPSVVQAAIVHAQLETIHPFGDGNGRVGRALIGWVLRRRKVVDRIVAPISPIIARQRDAYLAGLHDYRHSGLEQWVGWFADVCVRAADRFDELATRAEDLVDSWVQRLADARADAAARRLLPHLPGTPVLDVRSAADVAAVSSRAVRDALALLVDRGVLSVTRRSPAGPGRPANLWVAHEVLELFDLG